jgi:hypothetical protein
MDRDSPDEPRLGENVRAFLAFPQWRGAVSTAGAIVPGHGYETGRCAGYAANLNSVAASDARAFCSALI